MTRRAALGLLASATGANMLGASSRAADTYDVPVAAFFPMSGPDAAIGEIAEYALRTTVEIVHGDYDLDLPMARLDNIPNLPGARLKYLMTDHRNDPAFARATAEKLIASGKIVALIGAGDNRVAEALSEVAEKYGFPFIDADSTASALHRRPLKFSFHFAASEETRAATLFDFLSKLRADKIADVRSIAIFHDKEDEDIRSAELLRAMASRRDLIVTDAAPHVRGRPEATRDVAMQLKRRANALILLGPPKDAAHFADLLSTGGAAGSPVFCYPTRVSDRAAAALGDKGRGMFIVSGFARDTRDNDPNIAAINTLYRSFAHRDLGEIAASQFTAFLTLAFAINEAKGAKPLDIARQLTQVRIFGDRTIMPWEELAFDANGQNTGAAVVVQQRQNDRYLTVYPPNIATGPAQWRI